MAPIHGRVSRGGGAMLSRGCRRGNMGTVGGTERPRGALSSGHAYTERVVEHRGHPPFETPDCGFEGKRLPPPATTEFLTCTFIGQLPRTSSSTSGPYCSSLRAPMPGIAISARSSSGRSSAIAIRVLSVKTTYAGTFCSLATSRRHSLSRDNRFSSMSAAHVSHRRSMTAAGVDRSLLQIRQRVAAARLRRDLFGAGSARVCGAIPLRNRDGLRPCRPPALRASAQLSAKCILALVIPT